MPSSWSTKPAGTCPRASSCRPISPSFCCRRSAQSSTRSRTSGSSCATTGSPTASSNPTTISSTIVVRHGTSSSTSLGASCPSDCANGPTGSDQWDLVLQDFCCRLCIGDRAGWVSGPRGFPVPGRASLGNQGANLPRTDGDYDRQKSLGVVVAVARSHRHHRLCCHLESPSLRPRDAAAFVDTVLTRPEQANAHPKGSPLDI